MADDDHTTHQIHPTYKVVTLNGTEHRFCAACGEEWPCHTVRAKAAKETNGA